MRRCGVNSYRGQLVRYADAPSAVAAYELAEAAAMRAARQSVLRFVAGLQGPPDCAHTSYDDATLSVTIRRLWGAPSPQPGQHRIVVQADYSFQVVCASQNSMPALDAADAAPLDVTPPRPEESIAAAAAAAAGPAAAPEEPAQPCEITFSLEDKSTRRGLGVVDWLLDVAVSAAASEPRHTWEAQSCRVTALNFSAWSAPGSWPLANAFGMTRNLLAGDYGLEITPGAGVAKVSGVLTSGKGGIVILPGSVLQLAGEATDSHGCSASFEYFVPLPS